MFRRALGAMLAPFAGALPGFLTVAFTEKASGIGDVLWSMLFFGAFSYAGSLALGIPVIAVFALLGIEAFIPFILAGALTGLVSAALIDHYLYFGSSDPGVYPLVIGSAILVSAVYWILAERVFRRLELRDATELDR
jgi:hypothetical protein